MDVQVAPHTFFLTGKRLQGGYGKEKRALMDLFFLAHLFDVAQSD
jgi:hypothetical protein